MDSLAFEVFHLSATPHRETSITHEETFRRIFVLCIDSSDGGLRELIY